MTIPRKILENGQRLVVGAGVGSRAGAYVIAKALVVAEPLRWIVVDRDRWVIDYLPSARANFERKSEIVVDLRAGSAKTLIEPKGAERSHTVTHVRALEKIDAASLSFPAVMITDTTSEPLKDANRLMLTIGTITDDMVTTADAA